MKNDLTKNEPIDQCKASRTAVQYLYLTNRNYRPTGMLLHWHKKFAKLKSKQFDDRTIDCKTYLLWIKNPNYWMARVDYGRKVNGKGECCRY